MFLIAAAPLLTDFVVSKNTDMPRNGRHGINLSLGA